MGIDACIYFRTTDGKWPDTGRHGLPEGYEIVEQGQDGYDIDIDCTHSVDTLARYYGPGYERGNWGQICTVIMILHASENVDKVWYDGDGTSTPKECTPEDVVNICFHYMKHGHRPYLR